MRATFSHGPLGLGFRRLSIIDLAGGHQPMSNREETVWVVFNGEIYNFQELRQELKSFGHVFQTNSDTEVIIHGYKHWGDEVLNRLNGMFGLAIWDVRKKRLVLARDAFGIKLLYYRIADGSLYFGSEMRAVRATMPGHAEIDPNSLNLFLRYRFTPSPFTILKDVHKLAPGTKLTVAKRIVSKSAGGINSTPSRFLRPNLPTKPARNCLPFTNKQLNANSSATCRSACCSAAAWTRHCCWR